MNMQKPINTAFSGLIGVSRRDINPPLGIYARNWGASLTETATGFHLSLTLTCITFQSVSGSAPLVLIGADLGWWKQATDELEFRKGILAALDLQESNLMVCFSHTHAGPSLSTADAGKPGGNLIAPYLEELKNKAVEAIQEALQSASPSILDWRYGICDLATNRDLTLCDEQRVVVGFNPTIEADHTLLVGRITDETGNIKACIVNYACHPTTLAWENPLISPDYIGAMREVVENQVGGKVLFLQGASGELAPAEQYVGNTDVADAHGRRLAYAVLATMEGMAPPSQSLMFSHVVESGAPLAVWRNSNTVPVSGLDAELINVPFALKHLPTLSEIKESWSACEDPVLKERLWRKMGMRKTVGEGDTTMAPLWVWRIGNSYIVGQPNEAYSRYQQKLRSCFAPIPVSVINIVNGHVGYLPPEEKYEEDMYAVWQTPFAEGSLEQLERQTLAVLQRMANKDN